VIVEEPMAGPGVHLDVVIEMSQLGSKGEHL
jgi:hypothetical protein